MVTKLIIAATLLLIYDVPEDIQCACVILDSVILAQYVLYNNETLRYMEHALYRLEKTKIVFEHYLPINSKLCQPTFNYPKFYAMSYFVRCIQDYGSAVKYNTAYSKEAHKYLLKAFYNRINKKKYNLQIS